MGSELEYSLGHWERCCGLGLRLLFLDIVRSNYSWDVEIFRCREVWKEMGKNVWESENVGRGVWK